MIEQVLGYRLLNLKIGLLTLLVFAFTVFPRHAPIVFAVLLLLSFYGIDRVKWRNVKWYYLLFPLFYGLHLISYFFSENIPFFSVRY